MNSVDHVLIDPDDRALGAAMGEAVAAVNRDMDGRGTLPCSGDQAWELVCRMAAEPKGSAEWRIPGPGPNAARAALVAVWWGDYIGRRHLRLLGGCMHRGMEMPLPIPSPHRPALSCVYPDACVMATEHRRPRLLCVCDCGAWGPPEELAWMGPTCGPCHDRGEGEAVRRRAVLAAGDAVDCVTFSPDGRRLAVWKEDGSAALWDTEDLRGPARDWDLGRVPGKLAFAPDGTALAFLQPNNHLEVRETDGDGAAAGPARSFAFAPSGEVISQHPRLSGLTRGWPPPREGAGGSTFHMPFRIECHDLAVSPDGRLVAAAAGSHGICFWDSDSGEPAARADERDCVGPLLWSPDGSLLACGVESRFWKAILWDVRAGRRRAVIGGATRTQAMAFTPDGKWLITCEDRSIRTWEVRGGQERRALTMPGGDAPVSLAVSPDGLTAALGMSSGKVRLWPVEMLLPESW